MNNKRILIKLGGASLDGLADGNLSILLKLAKCIEQYRSLGYQVLVVHGGGPAINAELMSRNISWSFVKAKGSPLMR